MKQAQRNLIPVCLNPSPDYYCMWQTQLYATSDGNPEAQRRILGEERPPMKSPTRFCAWAINSSFPGSATAKSAQRHTPQTIPPNRAL